MGPQSLMDDDDDDNFSPVCGARVDGLLQLRLQDAGRADIPAFRASAEHHRVYKVSYPSLVLSLFCPILAHFCFWCERTTRLEGPRKCRIIGNKQLAKIQTRTKGRYEGHKRW